MSQIAEIPVPATQLVAAIGATQGLGMAQNLQPSPAATFAPTESQFGQSLSPTNLAPRPAG